MNSLNKLLSELQRWLTTALGVTVVIDVVEAHIALPGMSISLYGLPSPNVETLHLIVARWVGVEFVSMGRTVEDAQWLDAKLMDLLLADPPTDLDVELVTIQPEAAAALRAGERRMLATHRAALAYR